MALTAPLSISLTAVEAIVAAASPDVQTCIVQQDAGLQLPGFAAIWSEAVTGEIEPPAPAEDEPTGFDSNPSVLAVALPLPLQIRMWQFAVENCTDGSTPNPVGQATPTVEAAPAMRSTEAAGVEPAPEAVSLKLSSSVKSAPEEIDCPQTPAPPRPDVPQRTMWTRVPQRPEITVSETPNAPETATRTEHPCVPLAQAPAMPFREFAAEAEVAHAPTAPASAPQVVTDDAPVLRSGEAREIALDIRSDDGSRVQVRFAAEDAGHVHLSIRSNDEPLSRELRVHSAELVSRLEERGYEIHNANASAREGNDGDSTESGRRHQHPDEQPPRQNRRGKVKFDSVFQNQRT